MYNYKVESYSIFFLYQKKTDFWEYNYPKNWIKNSSGGAVSFHRQNSGGNEKPFLSPRSPAAIFCPASSFFSDIRRHKTTCDMSFLLYGANGYTGELILEEALRKGLRPLLAGRSADKIRPLAEKHGLEWRAFPLEDAASLDAALRETGLVVHAAGPFSHTARPMVEACLRTGADYTDITGEMEVFEWCAAQGKRAEAAGVLLMPGTGFDVVPTDCLAARLKRSMPDAVHLRLAFAGIGGGVSHGTAITMVENLDKGGAVRRDGRIVPVPPAYRTRTVPFPGGKPLFAATIPWGDVSTAYYTTGIPNIEVYLALPPKTVSRMRWMGHLRWLTGLRAVKNLLIAQIRKRPRGPAEEQRENGRSLLWGEVENARGETVSATLVAPEGYRLTAATAVLVAQKIRGGNRRPGFWTPAGLYGEGLIEEAGGRF